MDGDELTDDGRERADVDPDLAMALGLYALGDVSLQEAATEAGVTYWELEDAIESAGLADAFDLDRDVSATIDDLLDEAGE